MEKTNLGLSENVEGALSYLFGPVSGLILLIIERENKFISFHALQSIIVFGALSIIGGILAWIPLINILLGGIFSLFTFLAAIVLMYMAFKGQTFRVPFVGDIVWRQINK